MIPVRYELKEHLTGQQGRTAHHPHSGRVPVTLVSDDGTPDRAEPSSAPPWFASEIRSVFDRTMGHWTLAYLAASWLILQLMDVLCEIWGWSLQVQRIVCMALALGLLPALVLAWFHGEQGRQQVTVCEALLVGALLFGSGWVIWIVCLS